MQTREYVITIKGKETCKFNKARTHARRINFLYGVIITVVLLLVFLILNARAETAKKEYDTRPVQRELSLPKLAAYGEDSETPELRTEVQGFEEPEKRAPIRDYAAEAEVLAKVVYGEARGCSTTEQAAVIWCVLNRVDDDSGYWPGDVIEVAAQDMQFHGYDRENPVLPEIYKLAFDVLDRWQREKEGEEDVGRVLPADYYYFHGDGIHNYFRKEWSGNAVWDWSLKSPYEE